MYGSIHWDRWAHTCKRQGFNRAAKPYLIVRSRACRISQWQNWVRMKWRKGCKWSVRDKCVTEFIISPFLPLVLRETCACEAVVVTAFSIPSLLWLFGSSQISCSTVFVSIHVRRNTNSLRFSLSSVIQGFRWYSPCCHWSFWLLVSTDPRHISPPQSGSGQGFIESCRKQGFMALVLFKV